MTRDLARFVARTLAAVLLFAQLAVAAYACPSMLPAEPMSASLTSADTDADPSGWAPFGGDETMPACGGLLGSADATPNLCAEHCKAGQQGDHVPNLVIPAVSPALLYPRPPAPLAQAPRRPAAGWSNALVAASPPHAILHCVRRT